MARDMEIQKDDKSSYEKMRDPYEKALIEDWQGFKEFYDNHPDDLFSHLNVNGANAFHFAATSKDALLVKALLEKLPDQSKKLKALMVPDNHGNTPLHELAKTNSVEVAKRMFDILLNKSSEFGNEEENELLLPNEIGEHPKKLLIRNKLGETPFYRAAALGKTKMLQFLASQIDPNDLHEHFNRIDGIPILHIAIIGEKFETAIWLLKMEKELAHKSRSYRQEVEKLAHKKEKNGMTGFNLLALMPSTFRSARPMMNILEEFVYSCLPIDYNKDEYEEEEELPSTQGPDLETGKNDNNISQAKKGTVISKMGIAMWRCLIKGCPKIKRIWKEKLKYELALKLTKLLVEEDTSWTESNKWDVDATISLGLGKGEVLNEQNPNDNKSTNPIEKSISSSTEVSNGRGKRCSFEAPLLTATSNGIVEIVDSILHKYPQAVSYTSVDGVNILSAAIMFRHKKILDNIIRMEKRVVNHLSARIDNNGNTLLHHVADMKYYRGGTRPGPALQFQEELEWFEDVKEIMPSQFIVHRNQKNVTAGDLFEEQHLTQLESAQQWMKDTAESCSTVSILVATVVFAAAYTVPGGNNDQGVPIFLHSSLFWGFTVMDVVSLISSLCSVVLFLSILTSPFKPEAFLKSLPKKLTIGFSLLFFSILSSMITFTAALLLLIRLKRRWTATLVYIAAFIPVVLFALIQFPLYYAFLAGLTTFYKKFQWTTKRRPRYLNSKK